MMNQENEGSALEIDRIRDGVLNEIDLRPEVCRDPKWFPLTATVDEIAVILASSYMTKTALLNMGADIGFIENTNATILARTRWLRNRGDAFPVEVPTIEQVRRRYCTAAALLADEPDDLSDPHEMEIRDLADVAMGSCHMIAREFFGGHDALFHDL